MKRIIFTIVSAALFMTAMAQESTSKFNVTSDLVSRYVWRGTQLSTSAAVQPGLAYTSGGFAAGAWGSYALDQSGTECDLYASYSFNFGLSVIASDYFFPGESTAISNMPKAGYFDTDKRHTFELGLSYTVGGLTLSGYKYLNQAEDLYVEAGYKFNDNLSLTVGAGDQLYSANSEFNVVNCGLKYVKEVALSDKYSVKPFASFIVNPSQEAAFLVVGLTL